MSRPPRILDEKGQPLFEDVETDQMVREAFDRSFFANAKSVSDFTLGFMLATSSAREDLFIKFARDFKASKFYCPRSIKTMEELKTTKFATPELLKSVEEGHASERAKRRKASKKKSATDSYKQRIAASKAKALEDLASMQSGK